MKNIKHALVLITALGSASALASSHREAPLISEDPTSDSTDVYAFVSPADATKVTLIANYIPFMVPAGPPNYYRMSDSAVYAIKVDNTGDAVEDISFEFRFRNITTDGATFLYNTGGLDALNDDDRNVTHRYSLTRVALTDGVETSRTTLVADGEVAGPNIGPRSNGAAGAYATYAAQFKIAAAGGSVFVGPRDEGFFVDVGAIFDLLNVTRAAGLGTGFGVDSTKGFNVHSLAIEMPITALTSDGLAPVLGANLGGNNAVLGVWTTCSRPKHHVLRANANPRDSGPLVQVSRLGLPLINEVVVPLSFKDQFNRTQPKNDLANIAGFVVDPELSRLLKALYNVAVPSVPRNDLVAVISFLPTLLTSRTDLQPADVLRLNVAIPQDGTNLNTANNLGVIGGSLGGFPNGRRPGDDVVDILERVVGAGLLATNLTNEVCLTNNDAAVCVDSAGAAQSNFANVFPGNALNDGVSENDVDYLNDFPYLGTPHEGFVHSHDPAAALPN